jgi:hypothetical protein
MVDGLIFPRIRYSAFFTLAISLAPVWAQQPAAPAKPATPAAPVPTIGISEAWDDVVQNTVPQAPVDPVLKQPQTGGPVKADDFADHLFFESRTNFEHFHTDFTGQPTTASVIDAPNTGIFNPAGIPDPSIFQPGANRIYSFIDFGTRGYLSNRVNTHFSVRYDQDLTHVNEGAPAEGINEVFGSNRRIELLDANLEFNSNPNGGNTGYSFQIGRQNFYGAEIASFDGGSLTIRRPRYEVSVYGGRRFSLFTDPDQRAIGGANVVFRFASDSSLELQTLWYIKGSNKAIYRRRFGTRWLLSSYLSSYGGSPTDFDAQVMYAPSNGRTTLRFAFFQKLTDKDYSYDYTINARDLDPNNPLVRLYLGPIAQYSQFTIDAHRQLTRSLRTGGSVIVRRLNDSANQGPYDTSFEDYRVGAQYYPFRRLETRLDYHQRNSDRLSPLGVTTFDDVTPAGETSVKDISAEIGRTFGEGRFYVSGGAYYRRISMQDRFYYIDKLHQSGALASVWLKVDRHTRISADYSLDNDFFLLEPDIKNSQVFRVGLWWKY